MIDFPESVKRIIEIYESFGERAFAVGGCVRDSIMGRVPSDWDITTSATPERTIEIFESAGIRTIPTGIKHGTVSVLIDGEIYECTTHRVDGSYTDSRRPDFVEFTTRLEDDLSRRDFTVNAIAASPRGGIFDRFGGVSDIEARIIRCVGDPYVRFSEDALRILRALRFATVLDFKIENATMGAIKALAHTLSGISAERKTTELIKTVCSPHADRGVRLLFESGVISELLPDAERVPENMCILDAQPVQRLATLMWRSGAKDTSRLRLSNEEKRGIATLLSPIDLPETDESARRLLALCGPLASHAATLQGYPALAKKVAEQEALGVPVRIRDLALDGRDILSLGIPSRQVGEVQKHLLDAIIKDPSLNQRDLLFGLIKEKFNA